MTRATCAVLVVLWAGIALATERDQMERLWSKFATDFDAKPKVACICHAAVLWRRLGVVRFSSPPSLDFAACYVPDFDADGNITNQSICGPDFVVLGK